MLDITLSFKDLLVPARLIVDFRIISFVLNSIGHIQFYNIYTNNLLFIILYNIVYYIILYNIIKGRAI